MTRQAIKQINDMRTGEIKICNIEGNQAFVLVPYSLNEVNIAIEGETTEEQVESFVFEVNGVLDDMINHLEDMKL